jgi:hypothetical protein
VRLALHEPTEANTLHASADDVAASFERRLPSVQTLSAR